MAPLITSEFSPASPPEALAAEEALLEHCQETNPPNGYLAFWESQRHFVVLGYGNRVEAEVRTERCAVLNIPILRRCTGGGTVLQGPGCLNYSLMLPIASHPELETITGANRLIMETNRAALEELLKREVAVQGCTDLALENRKFSGNAQRRKREWLLFHGSFLLHSNLELMEELLKMPSRQPDYRAGRAHRNFLQNLAASSEEIRTALQREWRAQKGRLPNCEERIQKLMAEKYSRTEWNLKF